MRDEATAIGDRVAALKEPWYLNAIGESRVFRFLLGFVMAWAGALIVWVAVLLGRPSRLSAQTLYYAKTPDATNDAAFQHHDYCKLRRHGCVRLTASA
jgi:hypothetical protein